MRCLLFSDRLVYLESCVFGRHRFRARSPLLSAHRRERGGAQNVRGLWLKFQARYIRLALSGELEWRARSLLERLSPCRLCPRRCGVDRLGGEVGYCGVARRALLARALLHRGEEPAISGTHGSGTVFLGGCNLRCLFCQNHQISRVVRSADGSFVGDGPTGSRLVEVSGEQLADELLNLQLKGCHNINFVSPSHVVPQVLEALANAARRGLRLPIVWNSNGYEEAEVLRALDGVVDVYLPDLKYGGDGMAARLSDARGYVGVSRAALMEMARQVGPLLCDGDGLARRGLIVRHLVLPRGAAGSALCLRFIKDHLPPGVAVSLLAQYAPAAVAYDHPLLGRRLLPGEYARVVKSLEDLELYSGWTQDGEQSPDHYRPDFQAGEPFCLESEGA